MGIDWSWGTGTEGGSASSIPKEGTRGIEGGEKEAWQKSLYATWKRKNTSKKRANRQARPDIVEPGQVFIEGRKKGSVQDDSYHERGRKKGRGSS